MQGLRAIVLSKARPPPKQRLGFSALVRVRWDVLAVVVAVPIAIATITVRSFDVVDNRPTMLALISQDEQGLFHLDLKLPDSFIITLSAILAHTTRQ